jgi:integrase
MPLKDLRPDHIQEYMRAKLSTGASNTTVRHHLTFLHSVLEKAVKWQLLTRNPVDAINMPKIVKHEMKILDRQQAERIFMEVKNTLYYPIYKVALYTGIRQSELLALQWKDVDLDMAELSISKGSHRLAGGKYVITPPKTAKSKRKIALSPDTCIVLRQHLNNQKDQCSKLGVEFTNDRLLFCEFDGKPIKPNTVSQYWIRLLKRLNYPSIRFHDIRHTMASWMLIQGVNPKIVQERLGHASISTTLDIYSHVTPGMQRQAAEGFDKLLN